MPRAIAVLYVLLALFGSVFLVAWGRALVAARRESGRSLGQLLAPTFWELLVGVITDFFDTLGIGSFATTTALYRSRRTIDDRLLPGTLNVGHALPTIVQACIFFESVKVEPTTLVSMIGASVAGAWLGAGFVARWSRPMVQRAMGSALLFIGAVIVTRLVLKMESGDFDGLHGGRLAIGVAANFVLGVLMTMGVGLYAPCLVLVWLLGMSPRTGFPIMMGSCALLMPLAGLRFLREKGCDLRACAGLTLGGIPAVLVAGLIVKELPLDVLKWVVVAVVVYTAVSLLLAAKHSSAGNDSVRGAGSSS